MNASREFRSFIKQTGRELIKNRKGKCFWFMLFVYLDQSLLNELNV